MKALVYLGTGKKAFQDVAAPTLQDATDAIVRMATLLLAVTKERIKAKRLITHRFAFSAMLDAYGVFEQASKTKALKVIVTV